MGDVLVKLPADLTPEALLSIAGWLDTYDRLAISYFDALERGGHDVSDEVRQAAAGKEVQDDLRRWATEIGAQLTGTTDPASAADTGAAGVGEDGEVDEVVEVLDSLTDVTFLLVHLIDKGFRLDQQKALVKMVLDDAMAVLKERGAVLAGCDSCGSRHPETSSWHATHCTPGDGAARQP